ncbi:MAG: class I SAM-dependent methyltransferase [Luteolibacter sp.]
MFPPGPTHILHLLLKEEIAPGALVIDATAGNGYDTVFLSEAVGETGQVIAIDLEQDALENTRDRLRQENCPDNVTLHLHCHSKLHELATPGSVSAVFFNLGYLPGKKHGTSTHPETTLAALSSAEKLLRTGGHLAVVCYTGHSGGIDESAVVEEFFSSFEDNHTARYSIVASKKPAPFLLLMEKRAAT